MGLESMMKMFMIQRNEKKEKQKKRKPSESKDPNRAFLKEMVHNFFAPDTADIQYEVKDMLRLLDQLQKTMQQEPTLVELEAPVFVCGDIHGQLTDLRRIFYICGFPSRKRFLFLGDYVDRGAHSVEVICVLAAWKILFPKNVFLLRGNHELAHINHEYGFFQEIKSRWIDPKEGETIYAKFNECFSYFPLAAIISNKILCMHGGISPLLTSLNDIRNIKRPIVKPKGLAQDMMWADPSHAVIGFKPNSIRAVSVAFGESEVLQRLKKLGVSKIIRAHQVVQYGWEVFASGAVITVFSACRYQQDDCTNYGAVIDVKKNLGIGVIMIKPSEFDDNKSAFNEPLTIDNSKNDGRKQDPPEKTMPSYRGKTGEDRHEDNERDVK